MITVAHIGNCCKMSLFLMGIYKQVGFFFGSLLFVLITNGRDNEIENTTKKQRVYETCTAQITGIAT